MNRFCHRTYFLRLSLAACLSAVSVIASVGCFGGFGKRTKGTVDRPSFTPNRGNPDVTIGPGIDWVRAGREHKHFLNSRGSQIMPWDIIRVVPKSRDAAIAVLENCDVLPLTANQLRTYIGNQTVRDRSKRAYLVRGVEFEDIPGTCLDMSIHGTTIGVTCPVNPAHTLNKRPVVILTDDEPDRVVFFWVFAL